MKLDSLVGGKATVIGPEATLEDAARAMLANDVNSLAVVRRRDLVGLLTERDIVAAIATGVDPAEVLVEEHMSEAPDTFRPDDDIHEAARWLLEAGYRHLPVMAEGELLGIVGIRDVLWAIMDEH
jgi:CBS domain-containing protein